MASKRKNKTESNMIARSDCEDTAFSAEMQVRYLQGHERIVS